MTQTGFLPLKMSKRRAAVAGKVVDAVSARPVAGATAAITAGPAAFQRLVAIAETRAGPTWAGLPVRADRAVSATDGCFCFAELPDGDYTVSVSGPAGVYYGVAQQTFHVQQNSAGDIAVVIKVISLPPTGVHGLVKGQDTGLALSLARVRVAGSDDLAFCDAAGAFFVGGLQPGARTVSVGASGYRRSAVTATLVTGQIVDLGTITLQPQGA